MSNMNLDWRQQTSHNAACMNSRLFEGSAKEYLNQEIACHYQNLMHHQNNDDRALLVAPSSHEPFLPICRPTAGFGVSLGSYDPNLPYSGINYLMASNSGSSMLRLNNICNSPHFQKSSQDDHRGSTILVDSDGKVKPSLEDFKRLTGEVVSPEQISSVTTCSDAECYTDRALFEAGALGVFPEPKSGNNMELEKLEAWLSDPISLWFHEDTNAESSMSYSAPKSMHEHSSNFGLRTFKSEHCHLQSCPSAHVEMSFGTRVHGCGVQQKKLHCGVPVERSPKLSQLSSERFFSVEQRGFSEAQVSRQTDEFRFMQDILASYLSFRGKLVGLERRQQEFVNHLHFTLCKVQDCECEKYLLCISHFDDCLKTNCDICQPVRECILTKKISSGPTFQPCPIKKFNSESGKPTQFVSRDLRSRDYIVQDMQPMPKRMKMENAAKCDNWSLFSVILPHLEQHEGCLMYGSDRTNKEPVSSNEASTTVDSWNAIVDNGGSTWSIKSDGLLGVGQSSEGFITPARLNKDPRSTGNLENNVQTFTDLLNSNYMKLEKDDAISNSEENLLIVEDKGCIKNRKVKSSVTFECQSSHPENIYFRPQVGNLGESRTSGQALDLDNVKMGKDVAICHSEEQNMVDELQEIDSVKTSKVKCLGTFGSQDANSANICVLSEVGDPGKCLGTFNDACNLENINLGKDDAISHSEENNFVDEHQERGCDKISVNSDVTSSSQSLNAEGTQDTPIDGENSKQMSQAKHEMIDANYVSQCGGELDDLKASGVSLIDFFTAEQIKEHVYSLNPDNNLELRSSMNVDAVGSNTCQLCAFDTLTFTALTMCCTSCGTRIKHKLTYYWTKDGTGVKYCFCTICFKEARGGNISYKGLSFPKADLYKGKNTEESGEAWVQCDGCERWQHQICALYNSERDLKGRAKYICPFCRLVEIEAIGHVSITPVSGAQDLPRTKLSDYIEQRLLASLQRERKQRAEFQRKNPEEVPGASDLTVRVVLSVNKQLRVKQQFLDILHGEAYPEEFPYKSKVILLFQKVGGVDVCIFAMYVQEFGSDCGNPNKRSVYISYLDSVKYFRPDIKTVTGVALRTFVYHEILIGYLDYCKQLGFITCYIWACPPLKGEDYILHCHPETQKRPNSHKLVQWYKKMLKKGKEENVVVEFTNFYDHFFVPHGDSNCKITAARLPYFNGDYWSRAIEDMVQTIEKDGGESDRQLKNPMIKRTMKAMGHNDLSADATKDILVMQKLGHRILTVKEEFFVVHLQYTCTNCYEAILSGSCWSCKQCSKFHLCDRCFELERSSNLMELHTEIFGDKHGLYKIPVNEVAADTDDKDGLLDYDFFHDRLSFLNFCEKNFYRFDTLRRAKHSSMMILHHLHASRARAMETICSICNQNAVAGWHCETCSQFHVCEECCYRREGQNCHVHKLVKHLTKSRESSEQMHQQIESEMDPNRKSKQVPELKASQVRVILDLIQHANQCPLMKDKRCSYPYCHDIRKFFRHTRKCERRAHGGCMNCKKTWNMIALHAQVCNDSNCTIPRCTDIKNHRRQLATKSSDVEERGGVNNLNDW